MALLILNFFLRYQRPAKAKPPIRMIKRFGNCGFKKLGRKALTVKATNQRRTELLITIADFQNGGLVPYSWSGS